MEMALFIISLLAVWTLWVIVNVIIHFLQEPKPRGWWRKAALLFSLIVFGFPISLRIRKGEKLLIFLVRKIWGKHLPS